MADAILTQSKVCTKCSLDKVFNEFYRHPQGKFGLAPICKACQAAKNAKWREQNKGYKPPCLAGDPDYWKKWRERNPESLASTQKKYREANQELLAKKARDRMRADQVAHNARGEDWRKKNSERFNELRRARYAKNPERAIDQVRQRRATKYASPTRHTLQEVKDLLITQKHCCANCEDDLSIAKRHLDHWMPISRGGSDGIENLQWLCVPCNTKKRAHDPIDWLSQIGKASHWPRRP